MGKESGGQSCIIFLLIVHVHLVKAEEAPSCPASPSQLPYSSLNSCDSHLITELLDALICTAPPPPPPRDDGDLLGPLTCTPLSPPHDDGDLNPVGSTMSDQTVRLTDAMVQALLKSRNEKGNRPWEIVLYLMFPSAVYALLFCEINMYPRYVVLLLILLVNGVVAFLLPAECFWVPLLCCSSSLLTLIIAPFLR